MAARDTWGMERVVATVVDNPGRITYAGQGNRPKLDGFPATDAELRIIADMLHAGLAETVGVNPGQPLLAATRYGRQFARRWRNLVPYRTENVA